MITPDGSGLRQTGKVSVPVLLVEQREPGGQHQFAALEQVRQIADLADVHPAHPLVQRPGTDDLRFPGLQDR